MEGITGKSFFARENFVEEGGVWAPLRGSWAPYRGK